MKMVSTVRKLSCEIGGVLLLATYAAGTVPMAAQAPPAAEIEHRVDGLLATLTLDQKLELLGGDRSFYIRAEPSIGLPALKMSDGPYGVRTYGPSTAYAAGISLAATWDPELAASVGRSMARDAKARGVGVILAPGVNIYRSPLNGRNFEYFGEDPYLASRTAVGLIEGIQSERVIATVKHFAANNSDFDRHHLNAVVDDRTLREIYLPVFEASVREAHVGAVMDSYNLLNGERLTESDRMNDRLLKGEWKFDGIVMSDWGATASGLASAKGGLDLEMPGAQFMSPATLKGELDKGTLSIQIIDDKVRRILRTEIRFGFLDRPQFDPNLSAFDAGGDEVSYQAALASITLLKNEGQVLPLSASSIKTIAVIGPDADLSAVGGGGSSLVSPLQNTSIMKALSQKLGGRVNVLYSPGIVAPTDLFRQMSFEGMTREVYAGEDCSGKPVHSGTVTRIAEYRGSNYSQVNFATAVSRRCVLWKGTYVAPVTGKYTVLTAAALRDAYGVRVNGTSVIQQAKMEDQSPNAADIALHEGDRVSLEVRYLPDTDVDRLGVAITPVSQLVMPEVDSLASRADAVIVAVGYGPDYEGEAHDRTFALPYGQAYLIRQIASKNRHTIVTVASGGGYETESWLDHVSVLMQDWYFGQEGGRALADILFGHSPEGKLPITFERRLMDNPASSNYYPDPALQPVPSVRYQEGVFMGYRYYTSRQKPTLFPFGYGLSYTTFRLDHLKVAGNTSVSAPEVKVDFDVTNTGNLEGAEVPQVYVGERSSKVPRPVRELKGFLKVKLQPGETRHVSLSLPARAFAYFDDGTEAWKVDPGLYNIQVGTSSEHIVLEQSIVLH